MGEDIWNWKAGLKLASEASETTLAENALPPWLRPWVQRSTLLLPASATGLPITDAAPSSVIAEPSEKSA